MKARRFSGFAYSEDKLFLRKGEATKKDPISFTSRGLGKLNNFSLMLWTTKSRTCWERCPGNLWVPQWYLLKLLRESLIQSIFSLQQYCFGHSLQTTSLNPSHPQFIRNQSSNNEVQSEKTTENKEFTLYGGCQNNKLKKQRGSNIITVMKTSFPRTDQFLP